ncbi:MAG TPA: asparagine synthase (glutamine-hydrolyzing) [Bacteroidales bacterium]|nr:asparagine synthase (glutamine-hydrolyzing) [Bacteroidales bacterium]
MCGITGFYSEKIWLSESDLAAMTNSLAHRGPDSVGFFSEGPVGLGHRRLSIIDLTDAANQPMYSHNGRYVMVYNGEVFNFREIAEDIRQNNFDFKPRTASDSEIILEAFALWGKDFAQRLNGMFAIAIFDRQEKTLSLLRDRVGVKPLYYYSSGNQFAFASELKALVSAEPIKSKLTLNFEALSLYLHLGYIPAPMSIFNEIRKLEAGSLALINQQGVYFEKWWLLSNHIQATTIKDAAEALHEFEKLLESAVRYQLISDVPYGTFLSGGIDSSLVTAMAQKLGNQPVDTFTIGFTDKKFNEADHARAVAKHLGTRHHEFLVTEKEALEWIPAFFKTYDEPFADSSGIPTLIVSNLARREVTMTLSGDGGDELFMGYGAYLWARRLQLNYPGFLRNALAWALSLGNHRMQRAAGLFQYESSETLRSHIFSQEQYYFSRKEINHLLSGQTTFPLLGENFVNPARNLHPAEKQALFDLKYYLPDDLLVKVDRASMAFGLETRVPLLDYRIVQFAMNLDEKLKVQNRQTKWLMRRLLSQYIPKEIFERPKWGFSVPLGSWLQTDLKYLTVEYLSKPALDKTGILQPEAVEKLLHGFYSQKKSFLYHRVWSLVVLQKWLIHNPLNVNLTLC